MNTRIEIIKIIIIILDDNKIFKKFNIHVNNQYTFHLSAK